MRGRTIFLSSQYFPNVIDEDLNRGTEKLYRNAVRERAKISNCNFYWCCTSNCIFVLLRSRLVKKDQ